MSGGFLESYKAFSAASTKLYYEIMFTRQYFVLGHESKFYQILQIYHNFFRLNETMKFVFLIIFSLFINYVKE